jgi:hypothetical protein
VIGLFILGLVIYFGWGIKNSSLEQLYSHVTGGACQQNHLELKHRPEVLQNNASNPFEQSTHVTLDQYSSINYANANPRNPFDPNFSPDDDDRARSFDSN